MIWMLLLAHFLGDFPLQPDWMVRRKANFWVLFLHVFIHFVLMVFMVGQIREVVWPHLLLLNLVHMVQDRLKIALKDIWPSGMVLMFFIDQLLHYMAIWGLVAWIQTSNLSLDFEFHHTWAIVAIAYLVVTYTWYISERVINYANGEYLKTIEDTKIARMLARSGFISLFFMMRNWAPLNLAWLMTWPYPASNYRRRAIVSDLSISIIVIIFLFLTLGLG
jgi:hypothetical protein